MGEDGSGSRVCGYPYPGHPESGPPQSRHPETRHPFSGYPQIASLAGALAALLGCAHAPAPRSAEHIRVGSYDVLRIRSPATIGGEERLVDLDARGTDIADASGESHHVAASGELTMLSRGRCVLSVSVRVDGGAAGGGERLCSWRVEGDRLVIGGQEGVDAGARSVFLIRALEGQVVLEGLYDQSADGVRRDRRGQEQIVLQRRED